MPPQSLSISEQLPTGPGPARGPLIRDGTYQCRLTGRESTSLSRSMSTYSSCDLVSLSFRAGDHGMIQLLLKGSLDGAQKGFFAPGVYKCARWGPRNIICIFSNISVCDPIPLYPAHLSPPSCHSPGGASSFTPICNHPLRCPHMEEERPDATSFCSAIQSLNVVALLLKSGAYVTKTYLPALKSPSSPTWN